MNDRYLYRAKRTDNGEWVEGFLFQLCYDGIFRWCIGNEPLSPNDYSELCGFNREWFYIDESTICQYTGLTDKNGNKIWENDVVSVGTDRAIVMYSEKHSGYILQPIGDYYFDSPMLAHNVDIIDYVIGNIFDNADLISEV